MEQLRFDLEFYNKAKERAVDNFLLHYLRPQFAEKFILRLDKYTLFDFERFDQVYGWGLRNTEILSSALLLNRAFPPYMLR